MPPVPSDDLRYNKLEAVLDIHIQDYDLFARALRHRSTTGEHMERLEFLGDAVLGLVIAEYLHDAFPLEDEGQLSRLRAALVRKESLYEVGKNWQLADYLEVGEGERLYGTIKSPSIIANAVEAVIGAVFKDAGWLVAQTLILKAWKPLLTSIDVSNVRDAKSQLQEYTQGHGWGLPEYKVHDFGVGHKPRFQAECWIGKKAYAQGQGARKKVAELQSAQKTLLLLQEKRKGNA